MKKNKKGKKKEVEKIPFNLEAKIALGFFVVILIICFSVTIVGALFPSVSAFLWRTFGGFLSAIRYLPSQYCTIKIGSLRGGFQYIFLFLAFALLIVSMILEKNTTLPKKKRSSIYLHCISAVFIVCGFIFLYSFSWVLFAFNHPKLDTLFFKEQVDNKYTEEDLLNLHDYLEGKVIEIANTIPRDKNGYLTYKIEDIERIAREDLKNASARYWMLRGSYPTKLYHFDEYDLTHDPSTLGLTTVDSVGINYEQSPVLLMNTFTHELSHSKGIMRENEATLCSIMVGLESEDLLSQYSAYFEAYSRSLDVLRNIDPDKYVESEGKVYSMCLKNNYKEICDATFKLTDLYVHKSYQIDIDTYFLSNYNYLDLKNVLHEFDEYSYKLYIGEKEITIDELESYMDDNVKLTMEFKNSKKIFKKVQPLLEKYRDYFYSVFQEYPDMYEGVSLERDDALEYYTSSIPDSNIFSIFMMDPDELDEVFDYSRVVRLILEYFDAENIGYFS